MSDVCVCVCVCVCARAHARGEDLCLYSKGAELRILYQRSKQFVDKDCDIQKDCFLKILENKVRKMLKINIKMKAGKLSCYSM